MTTSQPHILFVTSDQHRGNCLGVAGHPCIHTPHLDRLAYEGWRSTNAFTDAPICTPARTTMVTGVKSSTYGCPEYHGKIERDRALFLGSLMEAAGYQTALVGKRHWHTTGNFKAGFSHVVPIERCKREQNLWTGGTGNFVSLAANELSPGLSPLPPERYTTDWCIDRAIERVREREKDRPLFLWVSVTDPHPCLAIHEPYYSMYDGSPIPDPAIGDWEDSGRCPAEQFEHRVMYNPGPMGADELRKARGVYYGMITNIDHQLGRLAGYLMRQGMWDDTLVVYTTDHGEHLGDHYDIAKSAFYNSSANIPWIVRPPKSWNCAPGRTSPALVELADLVPTFLDAAGRADLVPADVDGQSLLPLLRGEAESVRELLFGQIDGRHLVHDGRWKYLYHAMDGAEQLFAEDDRHDLHDVAPANPDVCRRLRAALVDRLAAIGSPHVVDGKLLNEGKAARSVEELRACNVMGWQCIGRSLEWDGLV